MEVQIVELPDGSFRVVPSAHVPEIIIRPSLPSNGPLHAGLVADFFANVTEPDLLSFFANSATNGRTYEIRFHNENALGDASFRGPTTSFVKGIGLPFSVTPVNGPGLDGWVDVYQSGGLIEVNAIVQALKQ